MSNVQTYKEIKKDLYMVPVEKGEAIRLNNIFFEFNKATLKSESINELERLYDLMAKNPTIKIQISGHTDNLGGDEYNLNLSEKRAQVVVRYLLKKVLHQRG